MLLTSAALHSPVMDEAAHLAAGISHWELGRFRLFKVNPPLVRMVAALPAIASGAKTDWSNYSEGVGARPDFTVMDDFVHANGERVFWLVTLARWALVPIVLLGGYVCYRWARELYGDAAGIMPLALWCFCPNVLAYGQIINADAWATALGVAAGYCFWKWLKDPAWDRALVAGIVLGLAELTKTTWLVLFVLWAVLWIVVRCPWSVVCAAIVRSARRQTTPKSLEKGSGFRVQGSGKSRKSHDFCNEDAQLVAILTLGVFCINAGYDFEGSGTRLRNYLFVSRPLKGANEAGRAAQIGNRFAKSWCGGMPLPLPKDYVEGIDMQWHDIEVGKPSYLRGQWRDRGWWYWYLYALALKVPLGTWGLFLLAVGVRVTHWRRGKRSRRTESGAAHPHPRPLPKGEGDSIPHVSRLPEREGEARNPKSKIENPKWADELVLLAPAAVVLVLVSSQTGFSRYIRYVLPVFPFVFIWIGSVACGIGSFARNATEGVPYRRGRALAALTAILLAWSVGGSLWYAPHWMSYFNELAGGPLGGPAHLIDAQVDWGQDLLYLKRWLDAHPEARPLRLVYFGPIDPRLAGIEFSPPPAADHPPDDPAGIAVRPSDLPPGWYAISVNFLYGYPHYALDGHGGRAHFARGAYSYFRRFQPVARVGYSIYIYHVGDRAIGHRSG